ncbi:hypothetical protein [Asanoa sp. NPDC050611]|uniref:hypothetical protein n=1 Tax=Asanoa sp. NPDC050611 TaxID=3157098 RepID=UPI0033CE7EC1
MADWDEFVRAVPWFPTADVVGAPRPWDRGPVDGLPALSALLAAATLTPVVVADTAYELLAWGSPGRRRGWLCHPPHRAGGDRVPEIHQRFWAVCGGFVEQFGGPSTWWENQNEVLTVSATHVSVAEPIAAYGWIWQDEGMAVPVDPADYYPAAVEANGNLTLAHRDDGRLLLFAPDHDFDDVTPFAGSPPCSLLTFDELPDLAAWIEDCAAAWLADDPALSNPTRDV